jgi:hypothetical protein
MISMDERKAAFEKIARDKGVQIIFSENITESRSETFHLDLNMLDQSIRDSIVDLENQLEQRPSDAALSIIKDKFARLLKDGRYIDKVHYVLGSGSYYFPEDIEAMIATAEDTVNRVSISKTPSCTNVCRVVCTCLGGGEQSCRDFCRDVCSLV